MLRTITITVATLLVALGCSKEENPGGHPMPWLYGISAEQKKLHDDFKAIIDDTGPYGMLDSFLVDTLYCYPAPAGSCPELVVAYFDNRLAVNPGTLFVLRNGRIRIVEEPFTGRNYQEFGLYRGSPDDFKYIEFGIMRDGEMQSCCGYSEVISLDLGQKIIEFTYPYGDYLIRLKGKD